MRTLRDRGRENILEALASNRRVIADAGAGKLKISPEEISRLKALIAEQEALLEKSG